MEKPHVWVNPIRIVKKAMIEIRLRLFFKDGAPSLKLEKVSNRWGHFHNFPNFRKQILTKTNLLHLSPLQHSTQLQSSYQFLVHTGVNAYKALNGK